MTDATGGAKRPSPDLHDSFRERPRPEESWQDDETSLLDLAAVFLQQRWIVLGLTVAVPVIVVFATLLSARTWTATASFMPQAATDASRARLSGLASQFGISIGRAEAGQTPQFYADLIRSREVLGSVATDTFEVGDTVGLFPRGPLRGSLADILELAVEAERPELRRAAAIGWLRNEAISVSTDAQTGVVRVSITSPWPELSARIAERILELVNEFNLGTRQSQAAAERRFIEERAEDARGELRTAENALQRFLQNNRQFQNSPELVFEHDRLQREVAMRQQVYTSLVQSYEQARIDEVRNTPVITVVEEPEEPVRPDSRRIPLRAALGVVLGGMLGTFVAFGREYVRQQREKDAEELREFAVLWEEAKRDVKRVVRRVRPS